MTAFRGGLAILWIALLVYTVMVIAEHGWGLFPIYFGDIAAMGWPGQFNLDFLFMLLLSGLWTAWRNGFSAGGIALGIVAVVGGAGFLLAYLLYLSFATGGDMRAMLLGAERA